MNHNIGIDSVEGEQILRAGRAKRIAVPDEYETLLTLRNLVEDGLLRDLGPDEGGWNVFIPTEVGLQAYQFLEAERAKEEGRDPVPAGSAVAGSIESAAVDLLAAVCAFENGDIVSHRIVTNRLERLYNTVSLDDELRTRVLARQIELVDGHDHVDRWDDISPLVEFMARAYLKVRWGVAPTNERKAWNTLADRIWKLDDADREFPKAYRRVAGVEYEAGPAFAAVA